MNLELTCIGDGQPATSGYESSLPALVPQRVNPGTDYLKGTGQVEYSRNLSISAILVQLIDNKKHKIKPKMLIFFFVFLVVIFYLLFFFGVIIIIWLQNPVSGAETGSIPELLAVPARLAGAGRGLGRQENRRQLFKTFNLYLLSWATH